jgi:hypothetical protein
VEHELPHKSWQESELHLAELLLPWCWLVVEEEMSRFGKVNLETVPSKYSPKPEMPKV